MSLKEFNLFYKIYKVIHLKSTFQYYLIYIYNTAMFRQKINIKDRFPVKHNNILKRTKTFNNRNATVFQD